MSAYMCMKFFLNIDVYSFETLAISRFVLKCICLSHSPWDRLEDPFPKEFR